MFQHEYMSSTLLLLFDLNHLHNNLQVPELWGKSMKRFESTQTIDSTWLIESVKQVRTFPPMFP